MKPRTRRSWWVGLAVVCLLIGCKTQFMGEPKIPGGAQGCTAVCHNLGMELAGMVVMGEYSDGCICQVPHKRGEGVSQLVLVGAGAAGPPAAGVRMQMDDEEEEAAAQNTNQ